MTGKIGLWYTAEVMITKDILYISLSVSALVATGFWVALLWYIIRIFRSIEGVATDFRDRLRMIDEILQTIKEKLTSTHVQLTAVAEGVTQLVSFLLRRRAAARRSSKRAPDSSDDF